MLAYGWVNPSALLTVLTPAVIAAPFGALTVHTHEGGILNIDLSPVPLVPVGPSTPLLEEVCRQFDRYFQDPHWRFSLPLAIRGSEHAQCVWRALCGIRPGRVKSYGQLARELGSSARAVAGACRANELPIIIPCHRVVASSGLGGYCGQLSGPFLDIKRWLLRHEGYDPA
jgi:methylated-DNA-[protein]-cysteine S-methyltransferase